MQWIWLQIPECQLLIKKAAFSGIGPRIISSFLDFTGSPSFPVTIPSALALPLLKPSNSGGATHTTNLVLYLALNSDSPALDLKKNTGQKLALRTTETALTSNHPVH